MILTGREIQRQVELGTIRISDFDPTKLSPNSYDLRLGRSLRRYPPGVVDLRQLPSVVETVEIPASGFVLEPNDLWIGESVEVIGSPEYVPILHAKSGVARLGLFVHVTADLLQLGFAGHANFQLYSTLPIRVRSGVRIAQVSFWRTTQGEA